MDTHGSSLIWASLIIGGLFVLPHSPIAGILFIVGIIVIGIKLFGMADRGDPPFNM